MDARTAEESGFNHSSLVAGDPPKLNPLHPSRGRHATRRFGTVLLKIVLVCGVLRYGWSHFAPDHMDTAIDIDTSGLKFTPCSTVECATLELPLDYTDPEGDKVQLAVARYAATNKKERIGTLLLNPGGPGGSGVDLIESLARPLSFILDGRYDLVSWDPRGMARSTPRLSCFESAVEEGIFLAGSSLERGTEWRNLSDPTDLATWTESLRRVQSTNAVQAELCARRSEKIMKYMGTPNVARDLDALYRVLEGDDALVNYWGFSYGTILGAYFVNMFPDRVGRVMIDGVVNVEMWIKPVPDYTLISYDDTEKALEEFMTQCAEAGPDRCAYAKEDSTPHFLMTEFDDFLLKLYDTPLPVPDAQRPAVLTSGMLKLFMFRSLYIPRNWPRVAEFLAQALNGNGTAIVNSLQKHINLNTSTPDVYPPTWAGVTCIDSAKFEPAEDVFEYTVKASVRATEQVSRHFGAEGSGFPMNLCPFWNVRDAERYTGPWNKTLKNEILVVGNTADPVTPVVSARATVERMSDSSRLLVQDGAGHCTLAQTSLCTIKTVSAFFLEGILPESGLICDVDEVTFPRKDGNPYNRNVSEHDRRLMEAMTEAGIGFYESQ